MRRGIPLLMLLAAVGTGCHPPAPAIDPFAGHTTIPPPATGQACPGGAPPAAPYYAPTAPYQGAPYGAPPQGAPYIPPGATIRQGALQRPNSSRDLMQAAQPATPIAATDPADPFGGEATIPGDAPITAQRIRMVSSSEPIANSTTSMGSSGNAIRIVEPTASTATTLASSKPVARLQLGGEPQRFTPSTNAIDIATLPPAKARTTTAASVPSAVIQANAEEPIDAPPSVVRASAQRPVSSSAATSSKSRYGYDPNYRWLVGQLEYSQTARQWKLRYIPIDGDTDGFGGSVVLADSPLLGDFQPGQFVAVQGSPEAESNAAGKFAPRYTISRIKPSN